jgi:hypothetical protein
MSDQRRLTHGEQRLLYQYVNAGEFLKERGLNVDPGHARQMLTWGTTDGKPYQEPSKETDHEQS